MISDICIVFKHTSEKQELKNLVVLKIEESSLWVLKLAKITEASSFVYVLVFPFCFLPYTFNLDYYQMMQSIFNVLFSVTGKI